MVYLQESCNMKVITFAYWLSEILNNIGTDWLAYTSTVCYWYGANDGEPELDIDFSIKQQAVVNKQYYTELEKSVSVGKAPDLTKWNQRYLEKAVCSKVLPSFWNAY